MSPAGDVRRSAVSYRSAVSARESASVPSVRAYDYGTKMVCPIEVLPLEEARAANDLVVAQVAILDDQVSWDWTLRSLAKRDPIAENAYRSTLSEPRSTLELAIDLTLRKVGLKLQGDPVEESMIGGLISLRYLVSPETQASRFD
ncbi:hypothetical protein GCM10023087_18010 [Microbacterium rhizosphaerae]